VNSYREKTTDELYEEYLNNLLSDIYDVDQSIEASCYMASNEEIRERHTKGTLGTLLKEQDPIAFHVGKREWRHKVNEAINVMNEGQMIFELTSIDNTTWNFTFLIKEETKFINKYKEPVLIEFRAGLLRIEKVIVIPMMLLINEDYDLLYESTFNYYNPLNDDNMMLKRLAEQQFIPIVFFDKSNEPKRQLLSNNGLGNFFEELILRIPSFPTWKMDEFDQAKAQMFKIYQDPRKLWDALKGVDLNGR
jgi:hypothetical protein